MSTTALIPITVHHQGASWPLWKQTNQGEPLAKDLDVAEWLQYDRPRDIRKLIERMIADGRLGEVVRDTVARTSRAGGAPARAYYLTEAQALKVAAKSETEVTDQVLDTLIAVFLAARDLGQLDQGALAELRALRQEVAALRGDMQLHQRVTRLEQGAGALGGSHRIGVKLGGGTFFAAVLRRAAPALPDTLRAKIGHLLQEVGPGEAITTGQLITALGLAQGRATEVQVGLVLQRAGWHRQRRRCAEGRGYFYTRHRGVQ